MHWDYTLSIISFGIIIYTVIPDLFLHHLGFGSYKRLYGPGVASETTNIKEPGKLPGSLLL